MYTNWKIHSSGAIYKEIYKNLRHYNQNIFQEQVKCVKEIDTNKISQIYLF
jgi:hypothetical protein